MAARRTAKQVTKRPNTHEYFMGIALAVRERALCLGRTVGCVLVKDDRIIATGYNGTPENMPNCDEHDKGCLRCREPEQFEAGTGYDVCICVHAEQNALISAARFGASVEGAVLYSTLRPCFGCTKEALQAKVQAIYYLNDWKHPSAEVQHEYELIQSRIPEGVKRIRTMSDPKPQRRRPVLTDTGHETPVRQQRTGSAGGRKTQVPPGR